MSRSTLPKIWARLLTECVTCHRLAMQVWKVTERRAARAERAEGALLVECQTCQLDRLLRLDVIRERTEKHTGATP